MQTQNNQQRSHLQTAGLSTLTHLFTLYWLNFQTYTVCVDVSQQPLGHDRKYPTTVSADWNSQQTCVAAAANKRQILPVVGNQPVKWKNERKFLVFSGKVQILCSNIKRIKFISVSKWTDGGRTDEPHLTDCFQPVNVPTVTTHQFAEFSRCCDLSQNLHRRNVRTDPDVPDVSDSSTDVWSFSNFPVL